jgi:rare lipoprotein A
MVWSPLSLAVLLSVLVTGPVQSEMGIAAFYGGGRTASGEVSGPKGLTATHRTLPFGTNVLVTNVRNGRSVVVNYRLAGALWFASVIDSA